MVQARISNYHKNTDFTTQKQKAYAEITLTIPAGTYSLGQTFTQDVAVDSGVYFENVLLNTSLNPDENYPANYSVVAVDNGQWYLYVSVFQLDNSTYRLQATISSPDPVSVSQTTVTAKIHLSVSPFA